jgi:hypothetical protein
MICILAEALLALGGMTNNLLKPEFLPNFPRKYLKKVKHLFN